MESSLGESQLGAHDIFEGGKRSNALSKEEVPKDKLKLQSQEERPRKALQYLDSNAANQYAPPTPYTSKLVNSFQKKMTLLLEDQTDDQQEEEASDDETGKRIGSRELDHSQSGFQSPDIGNHQNLACYKSATEDGEVTGKLTSEDLDHTSSSDHQDLALCYSSATESRDKKEQEEDSDGTRKLTDSDLEHAQSGNHQLCYSSTTEVSETYEQRSDETGKLTEKDLKHAQSYSQSPALSVCYSRSSAQANNRPRESYYSSATEISEATEEENMSDEFVQGDEARNLIDKDLERVRDDFRFQISNDELGLCHGSGQSEYSFDTAKEIENEAGSTWTESTGEQTPFFNKKSGPLNNVKFTSPSPPKGKDQSVGAFKETKPKHCIVAPSVAPRRPKDTHSNLTTDDTNEDRVCSNSEAVVEATRSDANSKFSSPFPHSNFVCEGTNEDIMWSTTESIVGETRSGDSTKCMSRSPPKTEEGCVGAFNETKPNDGIVAPSVVPRRPKETHSNTDTGAENRPRVEQAPFKVNGITLKDEATKKYQSVPFAENRQIVKRGPSKVDDTVRETGIKKSNSSATIAGNRRVRGTPSIADEAVIGTKTKKQLYSDETELKKEYHLGLMVGDRQGVSEAPRNVDSTALETEFQSQHNRTEVAGVCLQVPKNHQHFQLRCYQSLAKAAVHEIPFRVIGAAGCNSLRIDCTVSPKAPVSVCVANDYKSQLSHRRDSLWSDVQYNLCTSVQISLSNRFLKIDCTKEKTTFSVAVCCIAEQKFQDSLREFIRESSIWKRSYKVPLNLAVTVSGTNSSSICEVYAVPFDVLINPSEILPPGNLISQAPEDFSEETQTEFAMYMVSSQAAIDFGGADVECSLERTCNLHVRLVMSAHGRHRFPKKLYMRCSVRDSSSRPPGVLAYCDENADSPDEDDTMDADCFTVLNSSEIYSLEFSEPQKNSEGDWESSCVVPLQIEFSPIDVHYYRAQIHVESLAVALHEKEDQLSVSSSSTLSFPVCGYGGQSDISICACSPEYVLRQDQQISLFKEQTNCASFRRDLIVRNEGTRTGFSVFWSNDDMHILPAAVLLRPGEIRRIGLRLSSSHAARLYSVTGDEILRRRLAIGLYVLAAAHLKTLSKRLCSMDEVLGVLSKQYHITEFERLKQMFVSLPIFQVSDKSKKRSWLWTLFSPSKLWIPDIVQLQNDSIRELDSRSTLSKKLINSMFTVVAVNNYRTKVTVNKECRNRSFDSESSVESDSVSTECNESEDLDQFDFSTGDDSYVIERHLKFNDDGQGMETIISPAVNQAKSTPRENDSVLEKLYKICERPVQRCKSNNTIQIPEFSPETRDEVNVEDRYAEYSTVSTVVSQARDSNSASTFSGTLSDSRWFVDPQTSSVCVSAAGGSLAFPVISIKNRGNYNVELELIPEWNWITADPPRLIIPSNCSGHSTLSISFQPPTNLSLEGTTLEYSLEQLTTMVLVKEVDSKSRFSESRIRVSVIKEALSVLNILGKCFSGDESAEVDKNFNYRKDIAQVKRSPKPPQKKLDRHVAAVREEIDSSKPSTLSCERGHSEMVVSSLLTNTFAGYANNDSNSVNENVTVSLKNGKQITSSQGVHVAAQNENE